MILSGIGRDSTDFASSIPKISVLLGESHQIAFSGEYTMKTVLGKFSGRAWNRIDIGKFKI